MKGHSCSWIHLRARLLPIQMDGLLSAIMKLMNHRPYYKEAGGHRRGPHNYNKSTSRKLHYKKKCLVEKKCLHDHQSKGLARPGSNLGSCSPWSGSPSTSLFIHDCGFFLAARMTELGHDAAVKRAQEIPQGDSFSRSCLVPAGCLQP